MLKMSKLSPLYKLFAILFLLVGMSACERDDAEPDTEGESFSRLYISIEEFNRAGTTSEQVRNVRIVYPADDDNFDINYRHISNAQGGGVIYFEPFLKTLFQSSSNGGVNPDTAIHAMEIGQTTGLPTNRSSLGNYLFAEVTGLGYSRTNQYFFIANRGGLDKNREEMLPTLYIVERPQAKNGHTKPLIKLIAKDMDFYDIAYADNDLYLSKRGTNGGIYVVEDIAKVPYNKADSIGTLTPTRTLTVEGSHNIRGISYDMIKDVLALTDYPNESAVGQGRILIFDNFSSLSSQERITPTRIITGTNTGLQMPVDIELDRRASGVYLYVADSSAKKVFRFKISDDGNVAPDKELNTVQTPVGLALDARDDSTLGQ